MGRPARRSCQFGGEVTTIGVRSRYDDHRRQVSIPAPLELSLAYAAIGFADRGPIFNARAAEKLKLTLPILSIQPTHRATRERQHDRHISIHAAGSLGLGERRQSQLAL